MKKNISILLAASFAVAMLASGCSGLFLWEKGHYYHSEALDSATIAQKNIRSIGVYVFSNGDAIEHTMAMGLGISDWPNEVSTSSSFSPDTSEAGPSLELATDLSKALEERGYTAKVVSDLGHNGEITFDQCHQNAQKNGYDAFVVVNYSGVKNWKEDMGVAANVHTIMNHNGFLYIPSGGMYETKTGDQLWKNSYYGVVEHAHLPNFWNQPFIKIVEKSMIGQDGENYIEAAPKAVKMLLDPELFPGTTKAFPTRGEKKHRM